MWEDLIFTDIRAIPFDKLEDVRKILLSSDKDYLIFDMNRITLEELDEIKLEDVIFQIDGEYFEEDNTEPIFKNVMMFKKSSIPLMDFEK